MAYEAKPKVRGIVQVLSNKLAVDRTEAGKSKTNNNKLVKIVIKKVSRFLTGMI